MNAVEVTFEQVLNLAQQLSAYDQVRLAAQLAPVVEQVLARTAGLSAPAQRDALDTPLSAAEIDGARRELEAGFRRDDEMLAAATAPLEAAWRESGFSHAEMMAALEEIRAEVVRREFGDAIKDKA